MNRCRFHLLAFFQRVHIGLLPVLFVVAGAYGQQTAHTPDDANRITFDLRQPVAPPETGYLQLGGRSSTGHDLEINSRYLTLDGQPWLPVMGEFHFSRYPEGDWETEILKMKANGVQIVSTYVFWIHHEELEGQFDWSGQRDLRRFVELCGRHGMYVFLRIGPWAHGEARNGGFPDWLLTKTSALRENDPTYLHYVDLYFAQIGKQIQGLLWRDGGPIIGIQLENEYSVGGPLGGAAHIEKLKRLAMDNGIVAPLYTVTGWPSDNFPAQEVIPMMGGYPDGFWSDSLKKEPPSYVYQFNFRRSNGDMGAVAGTAVTGSIHMMHYPYFEAEAGGGMETAYHRRPLIDADDIAALTLTGIGSGVNLYGYYMFQGGANPEGRRTTLQESQATGYPNDLPVRSYDYQAPLGEYGQVRESYRKIRIIHLFLNAFGSELAPMVATPPTRVPSGPADSSVPRASVRALNGHGFLFVNNYVRELPMPARENFQASLQFAGGDLKIPSEPLTVPANSYFILPFNLPMEGMTLRYSTAQLVTKLGSGDGVLYVFFAVPGIEPEFVFDAADTDGVEATGARIRRTDDGGIRVRGIRPGANTVLQVNGRDGRTVRVLILTESQAEQLWKPDLDGDEYLALSAANLFWSGKRLDLRTTDRSLGRVNLFPSADLHLEPGATRQVSRDKDGLWTEYRLSIPAASIHSIWRKTREAGPAPAVELGPRFEWRKQRVATVPPDSAFRDAAQWELILPQQELSGLSQVYLRLDYAGDIGRAYLGSSLADDNFYNGLPWEIGLERFIPRIFAEPLDIEILPLVRSAPIYLDQRAWQKIPPGKPVAAIESMRIVPEYETVLLGR